MLNHTLVIGLVIAITLVGHAAVTRAAEPAARSEAPKDAASAEATFDRVHADYIARYKPLAIGSETAWWEANTTGSEAAFAKRTEMQNALVELHSDRGLFGRIKQLKEIGLIEDPVKARMLDVMYREFLPGQADAELQKKIVAIETEVEQLFNNHRGLVGGQEKSENDIRQIVGSSTDSKAAEEAWKAYMQVGEKIAPKLKQLAAMRNELARKMGFRNFYVMKLSLQEIDEHELLALFDELDRLTAKPFGELKREIDQARAERFKIKAEELRPWHFGDLFFQESPATNEGPSLDEVYSKQDLLALTKTYYQSMGMEVDNILSHSDLYEKPKKSPHAFATNLDRAKDCRVLCNLKPNTYWMDTLLHELGHAVYDQYIGEEVPFVLHAPSHSITTEGYAMMMGAMCKNPEFLTKVVKLSPEEAAPYVAAGRRSLRAEKLIFARWGQVMMRFERGMYENPDQDLGKLWWDLKKRYQMLNPPETTNRPDYAAKIHIVTAPVYYHSYVMGELFACQVDQHIARDIVGVDDPKSTCFFGNKAAGEAMKREIFEPGNLYSWNTLTKKITGKPLSASAFVEFYVNAPAQGG